MKKFLIILLVLIIDVAIVGWFVSFDYNAPEEVTFNTVKNTNLDKIADSITLLFLQDKTTSEETFSDYVLNDLPSVDPVVIEEEPKEKEEEQVPEQVYTPLYTIDASKYHNNEAMGFKVTEGNRQYDLDDYEFDVVVAVVAGEFDKTLDDALAVVSVILNRCDSPSWYGANSSPYTQVIKPGQFEVYFKDYYLPYMPGGKLYGKAKYEVAKQAVLDGLNGIRNNKYYGFRAWWVDTYSDKYIVYGGNRYGYN